MLNKLEGLSLIALSGSYYLVMFQLTTTNLDNDVIEKILFILTIIFNL